MSTKPHLPVWLGLLAAGTLFVFPAFGQTAPAQEKAPTPSAAEQRERTVSIGTSVELFTTLCALDAAGFDSGGASGKSPGRIQLRQRLLALQGPAVEALRKYYREHAVSDSAATLSRFVSFALSAGPPPKFAFEQTREELPPDALALEGFNEILANFYSEAQIDQLWQHYQPEYDRAVDRYAAPVSQVVFVTANYLREIQSAGSRRRFSVYLEPLVGGNTNFRNRGDNYALVVSPSAEPPVDELRHAYLHFLLDPIVIRHRTELAKASSLLNVAARAPRLPAELHNDFSGFFTECMVRAVELRLRRLPPVTLAAAIDQAEASGYVLVRSIYGGLDGFEKSAPSMSYYLPELIRGIDVAGESRRLQSVQFAQPAPTGEALSEMEKSNTAAAPAGPADPAAEDLAEGHRLVAERNGIAAAAVFERVLAAHPDDIRATYGLALASALMGRPDSAREKFSKVISASQSPAASAAAGPDAAIVSWSHIYLGRMYDVEGERELAVAEYRAALAVDGAPEAARSVAQRGVDEGYQTPPREGAPDGRPSEGRPPEARQ